MPFYLLVSIVALRVLGLGPSYHHILLLPSPRFPHTPRAHALLPDSNTVPSLLLLITRLHLVHLTLISPHSHVHPHHLLVYGHFMGTGGQCGLLVAMMLVDGWLQAAMTSASRYVLDICIN